MKCYVCEKGNLVKSKIPYYLYGVKIGDYDGERCKICNESFYNEKVFDKMTKKVKEMGLWGLETKTRLTKVGNALDIRLNKRLVEFLGLEKGSEATVMPEGKNKLIVSFS